MTRKKTSLWLHKPRRKSLSYKPVYSRHNKLPLEIIKDLYGSPQKQLQKHKGSPLKVITPKRQRLLSPRTPKNCTFNSGDSFSTGQFSGSKVWLKSSQKSPCIFLSPESTSCSKNDLDLIIEKLKEKGLHTDFLTFIDLVKKDKFPLENLSFLLFLETARFFGTRNTSEMRYSDLTKRFWKVGYRLFHGKFLYFMGGPKSVNQVSKGFTERGDFLPTDALINFAVPSITTIDNFKVSDIGSDVRIKPGVILPSLTTLQNLPVKEYMLCADGKKVTAGLDSKGGDVDMFNFEDGVTFKDREKELQSNLQVIKELKLSYETNDIPLCKDKIIETSLVVSNRLKECKELALRQKLGLEKFKSMGGEKWKDSKFVYVISALQASIFQIRDLIKDTLCVMNGIFYSHAHLSSCNSDYVFHRQVDQSYQGNFFVLNPEYKSTDDIVEPRFVQQRTETWHAIRNEAKVSGSTLYSAIGLRGLKEQKNHYRKFVLGHDIDISEDVRERMSHGTKHEIDAIATTVAKFMPVYFPCNVFKEEGCYIMSGEKHNILGVVSPDGSIRDRYNDTTIAAVEIKCPFPCQRRLSVHYTLPEYYIAQCLAEMFVLKTDILIYVSYSDESTTFLKVNFDKDLWELIWQEVKMVYDVTEIVEPKRTRNLKDIKLRLKAFVNNNVHFICELPSSTMFDSCLRSACASDVFMHPVEKESTDYQDELLEVTQKAKQVIETGYELTRRRATELMVWVLTNKDRNTKTEIPCSLPVAYGLKDYKLTTHAMRNATEAVLKSCAEHGLHVLSFGADGQWINLMNRDIHGKPLTLLQFRKDVWNDLKSFSKSELISKICVLGKPLDGLGGALVDKGLNGRITLTSADGAVSYVRTPLDKSLWEPRKKASNEDGDASADLEVENTGWLPASVINEISNANDSVVQEAVLLVSRDISNEPIESDHTLDNQNETDEDLSSLFHSDDKDGEDLLIQGRQLNMDKSKELGESGTLSNEISSALDGDEPRPLENAQTDTDIEMNISNKEVLTDTLLNDILSRLKAKDCTKWKEFDKSKLQSMLKDQNTINKLRHVDLDIVIGALIEQEHLHVPVFRKNMKKEEKVNCLCVILGHRSSDTNIRNKSVRRQKSPQQLKLLCKRVVQSKSYPKIIVKCAYARYIFRQKLKEWQESFPFQCPAHIGENKLNFWFSYPEHNNSTGSLLAKSIDCSHNLTHLRVRMSTTGICGIAADAWHKCAKSNETILKRPLVEDLLDKQSVPNARTHFSEDVESWLRKSGYIEEANLCSIIRNWYEASDTQGISSVERVESLLNMRSFLVKDVDFGAFPPKGRYIKGIPLVTYEGMLIDIDTKIQMYAMTENYNMRTIGSLAAETMVGIFQSLSPTSQVSIKAKDVPELVSSVVEIMACKANPNRGFFMRTSKLSGVYPHFLEEQDGNDGVNCFHFPKTSISPKDHLFDLKDKKSRRKIKLGDISAPRAPSRGAMPVRQHHKTDESKILHTKRLGIDLE